MSFVLRGVQASKEVVVHCIYLYLQCAQLFRIYIDSEIALSSGATLAGLKLNNSPFCTIQLILHVDIKYY